MRIRAIELGRAQRGWVCDVFFTVQTLRQFTPEEMAIRSGGRWILTAIWNGLREAKREAVSEEATPNEIKKRGWGAVLFCFMLLSGCCAVAHAGVQLQPEAIEITLPNIAGPPAPCPDPLVQPTPTITPDTIFVVQSNVPLIALQSPSGLLKITTDTGPLKIRGRFADGDGKIETRNYSAKYLVFVDAEKQGQTELIIVPHGCTKESDIVRQLLVVSDGTAPRPGPEPGPEPGPQPVAANVMLSIVEDPTVRTAETAIVFESLLGWSEFKSSGNDWLIFDQKTTEPKGVTAKQQIGSTPLPAVAATDKASGKLIHAGPLPGTPEALKELIRKLTGDAQ